MSGQSAVTLKKGKWKPNNCSSSAHLWQIWL